MDILDIVEAIPFPERGNGDKVTLQTAPLSETGEILAIIKDGVQTLFWKWLDGRMQAMINAYTETLINGDIPPHIMFQMRGMVRALRIVSNLPKSILRASIQKSGGHPPISGGKKEARHG